MDERRILEAAEEYLFDEVRPAAQRIDASSESLGQALDGLCRRELMALRRPVEFGGPALSESAFRRFQQTCAQCSGALSFLQTQHQSAVSLISRSENQELKRELLPDMADGSRRLGIGFSQLRRKGPPMLRAEPIAAGYLLSGTAPWVTGWSFYPEFVVGATLPDGRSVFAVAPLPIDPVPGIAVSSPMRLAAMESALTVSVTFEGFEISLDRTLFIREADWIANNDLINITLQGHFALGCARAGLEILMEAADRRGLDFARSAGSALIEELAECDRRTSEAQRGPQEITTEERLRMRAWAIDLAVRCAHAAVAASSGAANSLDHPAQRVYREALVYTVSAQTTEIMRATLDRLLARRGA